MAANEPNQTSLSMEKMNIFHMDLNYVSLKGDYVRHWLQKLKRMGFNAILWELEDKVQWDTCPECVGPEAMSKNEFREILSCSSSLGLEPIPLLQTVGHAEYVLLNEQYIPFRELSGRHDCYCTSNARVTQFLLAWVEEFLELFGDIRHFHLGGDEATVFAKCPECSSYAERFGANQLFGNHIRTLAEPLLKKNIRPGIWNDMIMKDPLATGLDPETYVIWDWNYWDGDKSPEAVNLHALGCFSRETIGASGILKTFPELVDEKGGLRAFASVQILKKYGFDVVLCSASRSHGDNFLCPHPIHAANIAGAAQTVISENLLGHCVTSWAIRLNDFTTQIPYIGLASYAGSRAGQSSEALLYGYCRELFGAAPDKFIAAAKILGRSLPFAQSTTSGVQWNGMKDPLPAPEGYLRKYLADLKTSDPAGFHSAAETIQMAISDIPEGIKLMSEFFAEAESGLDVIEAWLTGAHFLLAIALIGQRVLTREQNPEMVPLLEHARNEYQAFLGRRENPLSAGKNAGLVYDALIECLGE